MNNINNYGAIQCMEVEEKLKGYNESMLKKSAPRATFLPFIYLH